METLIFVLGILCGAVLLGIAYVIRELIRVKDEIKTLKKNKYVYNDRFLVLEDDIKKISDNMEIPISKLHQEIKERHSHLHSRIEEAKSKNWEDSDRMFQELHRRIDKEVKDFNSLVDSRLNKLENKFVKFDLLNPATGEIKSKRQ